MPSRAADGRLMTHFRAGAAPPTLCAADAALTSAAHGASVRDVMIRPAQASHARGRAAHIGRRQRQRQLPHRHFSHFSAQLEAALRLSRELFTRAMDMLQTPSRQVWRHAERQFAADLSFVPGKVASVGRPFAYN